VYTCVCVRVCVHACVCVCVCIWVCVMTCFSTYCRVEISAPLAGAVIKDAFYILSEIKGDSFQVAFLAVYLFLHLYICFYIYISVSTSIYLSSIYVLSNGIKDVFCILSEVRCDHCACSFAYSSKSISMYIHLSIVYVLSSSNLCTHPCKK